MSANVVLLRSGTPGVDEGGFYVLMYHGGEEFDRAGPFADHEDAEGAMYRALELGGVE